MLSADDLKARRSKSDANGDELLTASAATLRPIELSQIALVDVLERHEKLLLKLIAEPAAPNLDREPLLAEIRLALALRRDADIEIVFDSKNFGARWEPLTLRSASGPVSFELRTGSKLLVEGEILFASRERLSVSLFAAPLFKRPASPEVEELRESSKRDIYYLATCMGHDFSCAVGKLLGPGFSIPYFICSGENGQRTANLLGKGDLFFPGELRDFVRESARQSQSEGTYRMGDVLSGIMEDRRSEFNAPTVFAPGRSSFGSASLLHQISLAEPATPHFDVIRPFDRALRSIQCTP